MYQRGLRPVSAVRPRRGAQLMTSGDTAPPGIGPGHTRATSADTDVGVEGNSRLTAANGLLLTILLAVEGLTILSIRGLITLHIFLGLLLLTPIALKLITTTYRFARYYLNAQAYVRRGPP